MGFVGTQTFRPQKRCWEKTRKQLPSSEGKKIARSSVEEATYYYVGQVEESSPPVLPGYLKPGFGFLVRE